MSSREAVIEVDQVYKKFSYVINRPQSLKSLFISLAKREYFSLARETKQVLGGISFKIHRGESVGVVGCNGTGKSTLLRLLCGIYRPDSGTVTVRARIAPLVALGAGFHNDLSGYENIFLNGAILGVPRRELIRLVPQIIEFSELGSQIQHAVKTYSSGMVLRLAFSVAAHVDAPIVILDEVLGVGDAGFQRKCAAKIESLFDNGRTVLLVSHDMNQIRHFCKRCILLDRGQILFDGSSDEGAERYHALFGGA